LPEPVATDEEVQGFVKSLLVHDQIGFGDGESASGATRRSVRKPNGKANGHGDAKQHATATHAIVTTGRKRVLQRIRFH
jgi:hypothetical protein